jgi:hypothetical protein
MSNDTKSIILIGLGILVFASLFAASTHHQKVECLENGGKWITGIVSGNYSAFCIPK